MDNIVAMERYLPDEIVQRIIDFKTVKATREERDKRWTEYCVANEIVRLQQEQITFRYDIIGSDAYLELSHDMQTRVCETWRAEIEDTLAKSIDAHRRLLVWIDAKIDYDAAMLKVA